MRWADEDVRYIQTRSHRYPGALDISLEWAHEALADPHLVEVTPYPRSGLKASAFIGWSSGAQHVLVLIGYRDLSGELRGMNAWPASGRDLVTYQERITNDHEH